MGKERKGVEIMEVNACKSYIHILVSILPKTCVSEFIGYLKEKSSLIIFDKHAELPANKCGAKSRPIGRPFRPRLVKESFSRRENLQFILEGFDCSVYEANFRR